MKFNHTLTSMRNITSDLIFSRQTVPGSCKVRHRAINLLRKEHEWIRSKPFAVVLSGKSNTHLQGRVCDELWHDKKSLYLDTKLECSYQIFTLSSLTSICYMKSLLCFARNQSLHTWVIKTRKGLKQSVSSY